MRSWRRRQCGAHGRAFSSLARSSRHSCEIVQRVFMINYVRKLLDRPQRRVADVAGSTYEPPPSAAPSSVSHLSLPYRQPCRAAPVACPATAVTAWRRLHLRCLALQLRSMARAAADFAADYYEALLAGNLPVMSQAQPGFLRRALPAAAPERGESWQAVLRDIKCAWLAAWLPMLSSSLLCRAIWGV